MGWKTPRAGGEKKENLTGSIKKRERKPDKKAFCGTPTQIFVLHRQEGTLHGHTGERRRIKMRGGVTDPHGARKKAS